MNKEKLVTSGIIKSISEKQMFPSGSGKITFRIESGDEYNPLWEFELFKGAAYVEHLDNFTKYNKVGDNVTIEYDIKTNHYTGNGKDSVFTTLGAWKISKVEGFEAPKEEPKEDLPF